MSTYRALVVREEGDEFSRQVEEVPLSFLPEGEVLIKVSYAGLNYKDALSAAGHKGVTRKYPHTPGVDASGVVEKSSSSEFSPGQEVIVTSFDLGMNTKGGFAEYISVPAGWVVPLPEGLTLKDAMIMGTAAFTAALALHKMEKSGQNPEMGELVVTGASGGVGSMAVAILAKRGYRVIASSGKQEHYAWLKSIGAKRCISREEANDESGRPLMAAKWAGGIDTVGGNTLATLIKSCRKEGSVAVCGLVGSHELQTTVYPFILNGVNVLGVDSAETPIQLRKKIWQKLATDYRPGGLAEMGKIVDLEEIPDYMDEILGGETAGRIVAKIA
ncbi:MAG TPA: YhdH/YhfP family quinone oxidoreductase [Cryomorphaceae bacterium]|nr:YhdH/YhfP family quinone oxidoreductase [Cryomorphaceae bacterium]